MFLKLLFNSLYLLALLFSFIFSSKRLLFSLTYRKFWLQRWFCILPPVSEKKYIWIHAASVGEVQMALLLIKIWNIPSQYSFLISYNTQEAGKLLNQKIHCSNFPMPIDFSWSINKIYKNFNIHGLILIEAEFWYNLISLSKKKIPLCLVNARISDKSRPYYSIFKCIYRPLFRSFAVITTGSKESFNYLKQYITPTQKIINTGNLKFSLYKDQSDTVHFSKNEWGLSKKKIFIASSIQPKEIPELLKTYYKVHDRKKDICFVMILRHPQKIKKAIHILKASKVSFQISKNNERITVSSNILLIAAIGILHSWYKISDATFVGGSWCKRGGQNMIEPLLYPVPVSTGYNTKNFHFAMEILLVQEAITIVKNSEELAKFIIEAFNNKKYFAEKFQDIQKTLSHQNNSLSKNIALLNSIYF